jgi:hypothetical protein
VHTAIMVLKIENPRFTITLYENFLKIDLKGSLKHEIEEALENKPVLKETLGHILGIFVPLHISLSEITSLSMEETRKIKISIRHHRDVVLPLERKDAEKLLEKLNQAVLYAREQLESKNGWQRGEPRRGQRRNQVDRLQAPMVRCPTFSPPNKPKLWISSIARR